MQSLVEDIKAVYSDEKLEKRQRNQKIAIKLKELADGDWTYLQEALLDAEVLMRTEVMIGKLEKLPTLPKRIEKSKELIRVRFEHDPEFADILIDAYPLDENVRRWIKRKSWQEEVEKRMKDDRLFSMENRHKLIHTLFGRAVDGDVRAAQMWLKMSGDLDSTAKEDPVSSRFKAINNALRKKKN